MPTFQHDFIPAIQIKEVFNYEIVKEGKKNQHLFYPTVSNTILSEVTAVSVVAEGFENYLLTVGQGSIQVVAAFFLVISKQLYRKNLHQDKVVPLLS